MTDKPTYEELEKRIRELEKVAFDYQQIQVALRDSEERYRMLADFTYDWETWRGTDGKYIYAASHICVGGYNIWYSGAGSGDGFS